MKVFVLAALLALPAPCIAQSGAWAPSRNVEIIAPAGPASALDQTARTLQSIVKTQKLTDATALVVNKPGGAQALGFTYLNQHAGDGHYIAIGTISLITNRITGINPLNYRDVTPIANLVAEHVVFGVRSDSPLRSGKDFADRLRSAPGSITIAFSGAPGNHNHIATGLVAKAAGVDVKKLKTVFFSSGGELTTAVLGGHVDVVVGGSSVFASHLQAGRMRLLGVTSPKRLQGPLSTTPTWAEQGLAASFATFRGVVGPRGLTPAAVRYWEGVLERISASDEWNAFLEARHSQSMFLGSAAYLAFLNAENARIEPILADLGLAK